MSSFRVKTVRDSQGWSGLHQDRLDCLPSSSYIEEVRAHERHGKVETVGIVPRIRSDTRGFVCKEKANLEYYDAYTIDHRRVFFEKTRPFRPFFKSIISSRISLSTDQDEIFLFRLNYHPCELIWPHSSNHCSKSRFLFTFLACDQKTLMALVLFLLREAPLGTSVHMYVYTVGQCIWCCQYVIIDRGIRPRDK